MFDIKKATINAIETTGNPLAAIILQEGYAGAVRVGKLMASIADPANVKDIQDCLVNDWTDDELNRLSKSPDFIMALCAMLAESLVAYGRVLGGDPTI